MTSNNDKPLFINFYEYNDICLLYGPSVFVGSILSEYFLDIFSKMCKILNIEINFDQIEKDRINNGECMNLQKTSDKYQIIMTRYTTNILTNEFKFEYRDLSPMTYLFLKIGSLQRENVLDTITKIQNLLNSYETEISTAICYL